MNWLWLGDSEPVARKDYQCGLCGEAILQGEKHVKRAGLDDGHFTSFRMHCECEEAFQNALDADLDTFARPNKVEASK